MSTQDEVISLVEFKSPPPHNVRKAKPRTNRVSSPPAQSVYSHKSHDVVSLFSVKNAAKFKKHSDESTEDSQSLETTEISDDVFAKPGNVRKPSYKEKIRERFNVVKNRAGSSSNTLSSHKGSREKFLMNRVRKESINIDADFENARSRYHLGKKSSKQLALFSKVKSPEKHDTEVIDDLEGNSQRKGDGLLTYQPGEQLKTNVQLSEAEHFFIFKGDPVELQSKLNDEEPRFLEEEGFYVPKKDSLSGRNFNIVEKRLLGLDDRKWFNCEGRLIMQENPVLNRSLREPKPIKDSNITTYSPPTNKIDCSEVVVIRDRILELHLKNLKFVHHPLFSIEHVFERKLTICHEKYKHFLENNNLSRLLKRLDAIRHVKKNLQSLRKGEIGLEVKKYSQEIKELRKLSYEEGKVVRGNTKLILETWKCIKKIREANGYSNTNIKLAIKKEPVDTAEEKINQEQQIKEAIEEILEEHKLLHKEKIRQYKKEIQTWKSLDNIDVDKDEDPPKKPIFNIDEKKIESEVRKQFEESFKPPGEPILTFFLLTDNEVTKEVSNAKENVRRNAVNSTKISLRVVCNKIEVCKTHLTHLNNSFNVQIKEDISIQLTNIPESITIEVIEQPKSLLRRKITEIELTLPGQKSAPRDVEKLFEKDEIVHYKHEGVGSGIRLASILSDYNLTFDEDLNLNTRGILMYNLGWEGSMKEQTLEVEDSIEQLVNDVLDKNGIINVEKLHEWITSFTPDPQDPKNSILYEYISSFDKNLTYEKKSNHFRLNPHLESLQFCDIKEIENNIRLTMLQLRNQNEIEFDGMTIPNRVKEIPLNALADYKKRLAVEDKVFYEDDFDVDFEQHRSNSKKYLRQVHNKIFQKCKNYDNNLLYENVVNEKYLPYLEQLIKVLLSNFLNWFRWRPKISQPLPIVKNDGEDIKEKFGQFSEQVNIIIKINSGINLTSGRKQEPNDNKKNQNEVQRFIEISYNGYRIRSSISFGENPCWNEDLTLPIESQQIDYLNPNALSGIIFVNLFDLKNSKSNIEETDWIGCIDIPLAAVCCNNTLCGNFKVKVPYFLQNLDEELDKNKIKSPRVNSYLNMSVSIEPNIPKLTPSMAELPSNDAPFIQEHIINWNELYNNSFPSRKFSALSIDVNCKTNCLTKYLRPLEPPQLNESYDFGADQCARYVSLIPFTDCSQFYHNIWLKTEELLNLSIGSIIDHAVALTCYLLALKMDVWLLLGFGVPQGSTAYVLVREYRREVELPQYYIYDVTCNAKYYVTEGTCPLQRVYCLVNESNVWANIQRNDNIPFMRFDLTRRSDWLPLFSNDIYAPTNSVNFKVEYKPTINVEFLETLLETKIKKKISKLRKLNRTTWIINKSYTFKNLLRSMEANAMFERNNSDIVTEIFPIVFSQKMDGFILNTTFDNVSLMVKKLERTLFHNQNDNINEFALTVFIQCYPGQILSVWICLAFLNKQ